MDDRKLTVYKERGVFKKSPPQILIQGKWLEQAGFFAGDKNRREMPAGAAYYY